MAKKRILWHRSFEPALIIAIAVISASFFMEYFSGSGILMLSSIAASISVLTHKYRHHLTTLGNIISAYLAGALFSVVLVYLMRLGGVSIKLQVFALLFAVMGLLYFLNLFHPPAITFSLAFIIFRKGTLNYFFILFMLIVIFIATRIVIYNIYEHLSIKEFVYEFVKEEENLLKKEESLIKRNIKKI